MRLLAQFVPGLTKLIVIRKFSMKVRFFVTLILSLLTANLAIARDVEITGITPQCFKVDSGGIQDFKISNDLSTNLKGKIDAGRSEEIASRVYRVSAEKISSKRCLVNVALSLKDGSGGKKVSDNICLSPIDDKMSKLKSDGTKAKEKEEILNSIKTEAEKIESYVCLILSVPEAGNTTTDDEFYGCRDLIEQSTFILSKKASPNFTDSDFMQNFMESSVSLCLD